MLTTKTKELDAETAITIVQDFVYDKLGNMISVGQPCHVAGRRSAQIAVFEQAWQMSNQQAIVIVGLDE